MYTKAYPMFLRTISPLHVGSGNDLGLVDLPVQRERHTGFPKIEGSSLKGGLRESFELKERLGNGAGEKNEDFKMAVEAIFGPENPGNENYMGALGFTDARLLLFPVRSVRGVFAYLTCPFVLKRFAEEMEIARIKEVPVVKETKRALIPDAGKSFLVLNPKDSSRQIVLEEFPFEVAESPDLQKWTKKVSSFLGIEEEWLGGRLVLLEDNDFADFVKNSTEIVTRIRIDHKKGTVAEGALFNEEYIPAETVFYSLVLCGEVHLPPEKNHVFQTAEEAFQFFCKNLPSVVQLGGNATIGKGITRINLVIGDGGNKQ